MFRWSLPCSSSCPVPLLLALAPLMRAWLHLLAEMFQSFDRVGDFLHPAPQPHHDHVPSPPAPCCPTWAEFHFKIKQSMTETPTNALLPAAARGQHFVHVCAVKGCECGWVQSQLISLLTPGFGALFKLPLLPCFSTWVHGGSSRKFHPKLSH